MKKALFLSAMLTASSAFAANFSFTYFGNQNGNQSYYACSYVEAQTEQYLELVGATNIDVRCTGGISSSWVGPVSIRANFELPEVTGQAVETVEIKGDTFNPACGINVRIIKEVLKTVSNVEVVKKQDACAFANSNYYYKLNIAR